MYHQAILEVVGHIGEEGKGLVVKGRAAGLDCAGVVAVVLHMSNAYLFPDTSVPVAWQVVRLPTPTNAERSSRDGCMLVGRFPASNVNISQ